MGTVPATQNWTSGETVTASKLVAATKTPLDFLMNPPRVSAYNTTGIVAASGTPTLVTFDTEAWDTDSMHSTTTNTSRILINTSGQYLIHMYARFPNNATGYRQINLRINSGGTSGGGNSVQTVPMAAASGQTTMVVRTMELTCAAGDYYEMFVQQGSGSSLTLEAGQRVTGMDFRWIGN